MRKIIQEILDTGKYSEADIANYADVSQETIRRILNKSTRKPSYKTSRQILSLYASLKQAENRQPTT